MTIRRRQLQYAGPVTQDAPDAEAERLWKPASSNPFHGVGWSPSYLAFLVFVVGITTARITVGTGAMAVAMLALPLEKHKLKMPPLTVLLAALVAWAFLGLTTTAWPDDVGAASTELLKAGLVTIVAVNVITSRPRLRTLLVVIMISFIIYPMRGTLQNFAGHLAVQGRYAWNGAYENPNDLAGLAILQLSFALGMFESDSSKFVKALAAPIILIVPFIVLITQSRGALIALVVLGLFLFRRHYRDVRKIMIGIVALCVVAVFAPKSVWDRFATLDKIQTVRDRDFNVEENEATTSTAQRLEIWRVAISLFLDNPIQGVGYGAYSSAHGNKVQQDRTISRIARGNRDTHSTYLKLLAETGLIGTGLFLAMVFVTVRGSWRARKDAPPALAVPTSQLLYMELGLYGYLVAGIWGSYGGLTHTYLHFALIYVTAQLLLQDTEQLKRGSTPPGGLGKRQRMAAELSGVMG